MPFTVITMKKVPNSLRGDLTRWMQELSTGVYVGNFNSKVREYLWQRVSDAVGQGEATICYSCRNEIGYSFDSVNAQRLVLDYDGIPLILIPKEQEEPALPEHGFSNASRFHRSRRHTKSKSTENENVEKTDLVNEKTAERETGDAYVFLDIETTGLDVNHDKIIEIGAVSSASSAETLHFLVKINERIPEDVVDMTGITDSILQLEGEELRPCIEALKVFLNGKIIVGYNIGFDIKFLNSALAELGLEPINNKCIDLLREAKRRNLFQADYKFETTIKEYGIDKKIPHRAKEDAKIARELFERMGIE